MKRLGLMLMLASSVAIGCADRKDENTVGTAGNADYNATGTAGSVKDGDRDFVNDLTIAGKAEVELGKLAQQKSTNANVKKFGQMMVDDHTLALQKLNDAASSHQITAPAALDQTHQDLYNKLNGLSGAEFDKEYMDAMVNGHQDVMSKLESRIDKVSLSTWKKVMDALPGTDTPTPQPPTVIAETSDDPTTMSLNQYAATAYPTVYRHLQTAQSTKDSLSNRTTQ